MNRWNDPCVVLGDFSFPIKNNPSLLLLFQDLCLSLWPMERRRTWWVNLRVFISRKDTQKPNICEKVTNCATWKPLARIGQFVYTLGIICLSVLYWWQTWSWWDLLFRKEAKELEASQKGVWAPSGGRGWGPTSGCSAQSLVLHRLLAYWDCQTYRLDQICWYFVSPETVFAK